MNKQGVVSVWFGRIETEAILNSAIDLSYDVDGESVTPRFFTAFGMDIADVDEDFIEKVFYSESRHEIAALIQGCSYDEIVIPNFSGLPVISGPYNAAVLIYNYAYNGEIRFADGFVFMGAVDYEGVG